MRARLAGAGIVAVAMATSPLSSADAVAAPRCLGRAATITAREEGLVRGTPGDDVIAAYGSSNVVRAGRGDDLVCVDSLRDDAYGGPGDDRLHVTDREAYPQLFGGPGADRIGGHRPYGYGGPGDDRLQGMYLSGGRGDDVFVGTAGVRNGLNFTESRRGVRVDLPEGRATGEGHDRILGDFVNVFGSDHDDVLIGDASADYLHAVGGDDRVLGGAGDDRFLGGGSGSDSLFGGPGDDRLEGMRQDDSIVAGSGDDFVRAEQGDDSVVAGGGDDTVEEDRGDDDLDGGAGTDSIEYVVNDPVEVDLGAGWAEGAGSDTLTGFENAEGGWGNDVLRGTSGANVLSGGPGDDQLDGLAGDDEIDGGDGVDAADGGDGTDACVNAEAPVSCEEVQPVARSIAYLIRSMS